MHLSAACKSITIEGRSPVPALVWVGVQPMASTGSITDWIDKLKAGDPVAAQHLWERYCQRLAALARQHLRAKLPAGGIGDESDAALSAFDSFCRG